MTISTPTSTVVASPAPVTVVTSSSSVSSRVVFTTRVIFMMTSTPAGVVMVRLVVVVITIFSVVVLSWNWGPASVSWIRRRGRRYASLSPLLRPALIEGFDNSCLVKKNDPGFGVPGIAGIFKVPEIDIGHSLVWFSYNSHTDVSVLLVLAVKSVPDHIITGLWV